MSYPRKVYGVVQLGNCNYLCPDSENTLEVWDAKYLAEKRAKDLGEGWEVRTFGLLRYYNYKEEKKDG